MLRDLQVNEMAKLKESYFLEEPILNENNYETKKTTEICDCYPLEYAAKLSGQFTIISVEMDKVRIGRLENGKMIFAENEEICQEKFLIGLRVFNENQEYLFSKRGRNWIVRTIIDKKTEIMEDDGQVVFACVDSAAVLFGKCETTDENGFSKLFEDGRKIRLDVPGTGHKKYQLITRSYIEYSDTTGQAGFGFSRFVAIKGVL